MSKSHLVRKAALAFIPAFFGFQTALASEFELPLQNGRNQFATLIGVGTPPQWFPMLLDSGSEELWVPGPRCVACDRDNKIFQPASSTSFAFQGTSEVPKVAGYASGEVYYHEIMENVTCTSLSSNHGGPQGSSTVVRVPIGLTDQESPIFKNMPFDGIIGLAPSKSNFVEALYASGKLHTRQMGISLLPGKTTMYIGEVGPKKKVTWVGNAAHEGYWSASNARLTFIGKDGKRQEVRGGPFQVILDSGSSVTMMTPYLQRIVKNSLPCGAELSIEFYNNPTDSKPLFKHDVDVFVQSRRDHSKGLVFGQACDLDLMQLQGFDDNTVVLGKDWFEQVETWFSWETDSVGFVAGKQ
ncbi:unnamed protein product [Amoebophrya sp. A25]|nr:unnamed protein product [Amoebophrya sp. A25]|eukprot:GSA25T00026089001.1